MVWTPWGAESVEIFDTTLRELHELLTTAIATTTGTVSQFVTFELFNRFNVTSAPFWLFE